MESNITDHQLWSAGPPLAEPHFDEEATLLSAKPVVPIERISERLSVNRGFSRPWVFGFALAGALLFGVSATALYYSRVSTTGLQPVPSIETVSSGVQGVVSETVALDEPPIATTGETRVGSSSVDLDTSARVKAQASSDSSITRPNSSNAVSKKSAHRRSAAVVEQTSDSEDETRDRRGAKRVVVDQSSESEYETGEERGARREARERKRANRERRGRKVSDELLRIREIFEGSPRP